MGLDLFLCDRRNLKLTVGGCSKLYLSANGSHRPEPYEGRAACVACPIGAFHATGRPQNPLTVLAEAIRLLCPRCGKMSQGLINGALCRCCHARDLEARKRLNSKGNEPALSARLHTERVAVSTGSGTPHVVTHRAVVALSEVIIHHSKSATGPTSYGRRGSVQWRGIPQMEMML